MTREEALKLLRGGPDGIAEWNRLRESDQDVGLDLSSAEWNWLRLRKSDQDVCLKLHRADLNNANLSDANLNDANLRNADLTDAILRYANLIRANLSSADLRGADLTGAHLSGANLRDANVRKAKLSDANLIYADVSVANLRDANLRDANLRKAKLRDANLRDADLIRADLSIANLCDADLGHANLRVANLSHANLSHANLSDAELGWTNFGNVDLSVAEGLESVDFGGPCTVGVDTLVNSKGCIPDSFLRGCGFQPWQILDAKLHDPSLSALEIEDLQYKIFNARTAADAFIGGTFISYARADGRPVEKLHKHLTEKGVPVWLDIHKLTAGPLQGQVDRAIRRNDVVLLVLSKNSIDSKWVEHELKVARRREEREQRNILCPIALDESWKPKVSGAHDGSAESDIDWEHLEKKNVLDFSKWKTKAFDTAFEKLMTGLKTWYGRQPEQ